MADTKTDPDEALLARLRPLFARRKGFTERRMFGGTYFSLNGHLCVGTWNGDLVVRLDREDHDALMAEPNTAPMDFTGKVLFGYVMVKPAGIKTDAKLKAWIERAIAHVSSLPKKEKKTAKGKTKKKK